MARTLPLPPIVGTGAYTFHDAHVLTGIPRDKVQRWALDEAAATSRRQPPVTRLLIPESPSLLQRGMITFRDLLELECLHLLRNVKLPMPYLRRVLRGSRVQLGDSHPLSNGAMKYNNLGVYIDRTEEGGRLADAADKQLMFDVMRPFLRTLSFHGHAPSKWHIGRAYGDERPVVDPRRSFGEPIIDACSVPTLTLACYARKVGTEKTARIFEIDAEDVRSAVTLERHLGRYDAA